MKLHERITKRASLEMVKDMLPSQIATVIDVGAQKGTLELYEVFPESHHLLFEPVAEHEDDLKRISSELKHCDYAIVAITNTDGEVNLSITPNRMYAAVTPQTEVLGREIRIVKASRLDTLVGQIGTKGPYLMKIDTDGHELAVLEGAKQTLQYTEYVVIESTLFIQFHTVIDFMRKQGFVVYDILEPLYRLLDGALWQVDLAFVPKNSPLRSQKYYATEEQFKSMTGAK